MPATFLLLRKNKESGPFSLEVLLQQGLTARDLVWVEGSSVAWAAPAEVPQLRSNLTAAAGDANATPRKAAPQTGQRPRGSHIYVSLPAGVGPRRSALPEEATSDIEKQAEALQQRILSFTAGAAVPAPEAGYARSLNEMQEQYANWQTAQKKGKVSRKLIRRAAFAGGFFVLFAGSLLLAAKRSPKQQVVVENAAPAAVLPAAAPQLVPMQASRQGVPQPPPDTAAVRLVLHAETYEPAQKKRTNKVQAKSKATGQSLAKDSAAAKQPAAEAKLSPPPYKAIPRTAPLAQQLVLKNNFEFDTRGTLQTPAAFTLQNNSSETLRTINVEIVYFKKERELTRETILFKNVAPGATVAGEGRTTRRATNATLKLGNVIREDGSLYLAN